MNIKQKGFRTHVDISRAPGYGDNDDPGETDLSGQQRENLFKALLRAAGAIKEVGRPATLPGTTENRYRHLQRCCCPLKVSPTISPALKPQEAESARRAAATYIVTPERA